jgi:membrane-bound serine protease (ClpP class)
MRVSRVVSIICAGLTVGLLASSELGAAPIYKVQLDDIIHGVNARFVIRTIDQAGKDGAELVLIEVNTPGGLYDSTRQIIEAILSSKVPVVVYVAPSGAHAASAGFLITIAADYAVMAPGTNTGASTPISGTGQEMEETLAKKVKNDAAAYTRSIAERRHRNPEVAEQAVTEARAWTAQEALDAGLVDLIATNESELLAKLDGVTVKRVDGQEVTFHTANATVDLREMSVKERFLSVIANPNIAVLLGLIGLAGLYLEFTHPGTFVPGVVGGIALLLAAFALEILPVNIVGVLLLIVGFGLLIAEALTPSFGALGTGGIVGIVLGALMLFQEQPLPSPALHVDLLVILPVVVFFGLLVIFLSRLVLQAHRRVPVTGSEGLVGMLATTRTAIEGRGKVFVHGEYWNARSKEPIPEGATVKIVRVDGLVLDVVKAQSET